MYCKDNNQRAVNCPSCKYQCEEYLKYKKMEDERK